MRLNQNEELLKEEQLRVELKRKNELDDLAHVLSSPQGRRFIWRLMGYCGYARLAKDPSGSETYFKLGQQKIAFFLLDEMLAADPNAYISMIKERGEKR